MFLFKYKLFVRLVQKMDRIAWWHIAGIIILHCFTSWWLCCIFEPAAEYVQADTFWYFYIVTVTTVGYGDFSPAELGSRLVVSAYIMPIGIAGAGVVIGKIAAFVVEIYDKLRRGLMELNISGHTVVIGDNSEHTVRLLQNLLEDDSCGEVVLLSERQENPLNGSLAGFVSGLVDQPEVQRRACLADALTVIILGESDVVVTGRTIAVANNNNKARIIAYFKGENAARDLDRQTDDRVKTVVSTDMHVLVQEALDPGAASFVEQLVHNSHEETYLQLEIPQGFEGTFLEVTTKLMEDGINVLAVYIDGEPEMCPGKDFRISAGNLLAVAANNRSVLDKIDWVSV